LALYVFWVTAVPGIPRQGPPFNHDFSFYLWLNSLVLLYSKDSCYILLHPLTNNIGVLAFVLSLIETLYKKKT